MFYGYIPDSSAKRAITFGLLIALASLHNLSRTIGVAMLFAVQANYAYALVIGEVVIHHLYKIYRKDYVVWCVGLSGATMWITAFFTHSVAKILADFTGCVHVRGPKLMGGLAFAVSTLISQCLPFVSYHFYTNDESLENPMPQRELLWGLVGITTLWAMSAGTFMKVIKKGYRKTFFGTVTGKQFTIDSFQASDDPQTKMLTAFDNHISFIKPIKEEVKKYVADNWDSWVDEDWLTPGFIAQIPDEFIPSHALRALNVGGPRERRRQSFSVREKGGGNGNGENE